MADSIEQEIERLKKMTVPELRQRHFDLFGEWPRSHHRRFLRRQLAWKIQASREGGLSEELKQMALAIARNHPLRSRIADSSTRRSKGLPIDNVVRTTLVTRTDSRIPMPGSLLIKELRGSKHVVRVLDDGFEYEDQKFGSLSAVAQAISGTKWNGYTFFGLK